MAPKLFKKRTRKQTICDISSTYCDDFDVLSPLEKGQAYVVTSDDGERRFFTEQQNFNQEVGNSSRLRLTLNPGKHLPFFRSQFCVWKICWNQGRMKHKAN